MVIFGGVVIGLEVITCIAFSAMLSRLLGGARYMVMVGGPFRDSVGGFKADIQTIMGSLQVVRVSLFSFSWAKELER